MPTNKKQLFPALVATIESLNTAELSAERKAVLQPLIDYIRAQQQANTAVRINFICTHNSRRSVLSQVWAKIMGVYHGIELSTYSGGTEATAVFPMIIKTLQATAYQIQSLSEGDNPVYSIKYGANEDSLIAFSKTYDNAFNPQSDFAAVMTCSQADGDCPFIAGAAKRIPITYEDPKAFDGTAQQAEKYEERSLQIATEMLYVFAQSKL